MTTHNLKLVQPYFDAVADGTKTFEVREDDRGYEVGDTLRLREWETTTRVVEGHDGYLIRVASDEYTGRELKREVTYILRGPAFGIEDGYVVMGIKPIPVAPFEGIEDDDGFMDIHSPQGTKVRFMARGGHEWQTEEAKAVLTLGELYTVKSIEVGQSCSYVTLEEFPKVTFNTVLFDKAVAT